MVEEYQALKNDPLVKEYQALKNDVEKNKKVPNDKMDALKKLEDQGALKKLEDLEDLEIICGKKGDGRGKSWKDSTEYLDPEIATIMVG